MANSIKHNYILLLIFFIASSSGNAQNNKYIDSLKQSLTTLQNDTVKIKALLEVGYRYKNSNPDFPDLLFSFSNISKADWNSLMAPL